MSKQKFDPPIHRIRLEKLTIFEIKEAELEALEQGSPVSLHFNLGIAAFSVAVSFLIALLTTTIDDIKTFCVFVIITSIGFLAGTTFACLWWLSSEKLGNVARGIRKRMPPEGDPENLNAEGTTSV